MNIQIEEFSLDSDDSMVFMITIDTETYTLPYHKTDNNVWQSVLRLELLFNLDTQFIVE